MADEKRRLKVWMMETGGWGGIHYYAHALCNALEDCSVDLAMLTTEAQYELEDWPHPFKRIRFFRRENYLLSMFRFIRLLLRQRPDILHIQTLLAPRKDAVLLLICRLFKVQVVITVHNILPHEVRRFEPWIFAHYYRSAAALILHSELNRSQLLEWLPSIEAEKTHVVAHGNYEGFRKLELDRSAARAHLGLPEDGQIALFFGAIRPYKGLDLLLQTINPVKEACPEAIFVVAGIISPELEAMYKAQIAALGIGNEALIARFGYLSTEDAIAYVCAADLVVLPYREIYQSGVLFWAYSFGRGVLATRTGSFPEAVEEDKSGWLVEVESVEALERTLSRVLKDPAKLAEVGEYARKLASTNYNWGGIARKTVQVYEEYGKL